MRFVWTCITKKAPYDMEKPYYSKETALCSTERAEYEKEAHVRKSNTKEPRMRKSPTYIVKHLYNTFRLDFLFFLLLRVGTYLCVCVREKMCVFTCVYACLFLCACLCACVFMRLQLFACVCVGGCLDISVVSYVTNQVKRVRFR